MPFHHCHFSEWWSHMCLRYIGNLFLMIYKPQLHICAKSHCYQSALKNNSLQFFPPKLIINSGTRALFMISAVDIRTKLTIGSFKCVWPIIMCFKYLLCSLFGFLAASETNSCAFMLHDALSHSGSDYKRGSSPIFFVNTLLRGQSVSFSHAWCSQTVTAAS